MEAYELAFRMQSAGTDAFDLSQEPAYIREMYGDTTQGRNLLLARRLAERGVRFVQLFHPDWDHHSRLTSWCTARCRDTDQASAALVKDLKQRGLLDETVVHWGGEMGRLPVIQNDAGRAKTVVAGQQFRGRP